MARANRLKSTVARESTNTEWGSTAISIAMLYAATPGMAACAISALQVSVPGMRSSPRSRASVAEVTYRWHSRSTTFVATIVIRVYPAIRPVSRRPMPFQPNRGRRPRPSPRSGRKRITACSTTPRVWPPASTTVCAVVHPARSSPARYAPNMPRYSTIAPIATTLFSTGAHM